jgi:hypothetical protein
LLTGLGTGRQVKKPEPASIVEGVNRKTLNQGKVKGVRGLRRETYRSCDDCRNVTTKESKI